jgi:hypothetical protein
VGGLISKSFILINLGALPPVDRVAPAFVRLFKIDSFSKLLDLSGMWLSKGIIGMFLTNANVLMHIRVTLLLVKEPGPIHIAKKLKLSRGCFSKMNSRVVKRVSVQDLPSNEFFNRTTFSSTTEM